MIVDNNCAPASVWPPTIMNYHWLSSFSLSLFKFFMIVDDSFSRLTTRMIVHDSISVSCFGNHWPDSCQKTCCRPLSSRKIHTFNLQVCLTGRHLVLTFLRGKSLEFAAVVTLLARLRVIFKLRLKSQPCIEVLIMPRIGISVFGIKWRIMTI